MAQYSFKRFRRMSAGSTAGRLDGSWTADAPAEADAVKEFHDRIEELDLTTHFAMIEDETGSFVRFWLEGKPNA